MTKFLAPFPGGCNEDGENKKQATSINAPAGLRQSTRRGDTSSVRFRFHSHRRCQFAGVDTFGGDAKAECSQND